MCGRFIPCWCSLCKHYMLCAHTLIPFHKFSWFALNYSQTCMFVCVCTHTHTYTHIHTQTHTHTHTHTHSCLCMYIYIYIYIHTHTHKQEYAFFLHKCCASWLPNIYTIFMSSSEYDVVGAYTCALSLVSSALLCTEQVLLLCG